MTGQVHTPGPGANDGPLRSYPSAPMAPTGAADSEPGVAAHPSARHLVLSVAVGPAMSDERLSPGLPSLRAHMPYETAHVVIVADKPYPSFAKVRRLLLFFFFLFAFLFFLSYIFSAFLSFPFLYFFRSFVRLFVRSSSIFPLSRSSFFLSIYGWIL